MKWILLLFSIVIVITGCAQNKSVEYFLTDKDKYNLPISSVPLIKDGIVYFGSFDNNFYAIDLKTGKELWRFKTGKPIFSSPSVVNDKVLFASYDGYLYNLDKKTGNLIWKSKISHIGDFYDYTPFFRDMQNLVSIIMAFWKTPMSVGGAGRNIQYLTPKSIRNYVSNDRFNTPNAKYFLSINTKDEKVLIGGEPRDEYFKKNKRFPIIILNLKNGGIEVHSGGVVVHKDNFQSPFER